MAERTSEEGVPPQAEPEPEPEPALAATASAEQPSPGFQVETPRSVAGRSLRKQPSADDALASPEALEVEEPTAAESALEGWLEKWRRSWRPGGHWERRYFVIERGSKVLKYFKAEGDYQDGSSRWKELRFEHMYDAHVMWDTGQSGEAARETALQFQFDYSQKDKVYCLRASSTEERNRWFGALESSIRAHHRRRAVRAITSGHLPDPSDTVTPDTPTADRFSFKDVEGWATPSEGSDSPKDSPRIVRLGDEWDRAGGGGPWDDDDSDEEAGQPLRTGSAEPASGDAGLRRQISALEPRSVAGASEGGGAKAKSVFRKLRKRAQSSGNLERASVSPPLAPATKSRFEAAKITRLLVRRAPRRSSCAPTPAAWWNCGRGAASGRAARPTGATSAGRSTATTASASATSAARAA